MTPTALSADERERIEALSRLPISDTLQLSQVMERALAYSPNGILICDALQPDYPLVYVNPAFERITGYSAAEVLGRNCRFLQAADTNQPALEQLRAAIHSGRETRVILRNYRKDGTLFWNELSITPVHDPAGIVNHFVGIQNDITEHQQSDEERDLLLMATQAIIAAADLDAALQAVLRLVCDMSGWAYGEAWIPTNDETALVCSPAWYSGSAQLAEFRATSETTLLAPGCGLPGRAWASRRNEYIADLTNVPETESIRLHSALRAGIRAGLAVPITIGNQVLAVLAFFVTETRATDRQKIDIIVTVAAQLGVLIQRKRAEMALESERALLVRRVAERTADLSAANAQLERASRLKDEFLANMSHELRTPLNSILGFSEALQEQTFGSLTPRQMRYIDGVMESGRHLLALINDILDLSKIEANQMTLNVGSVAIGELCQASIRLIKQAALMRRLHVSFSIDPDVIFMQADERRIKQVLVNLLSNAVKFTPDDGAIGLEVYADQPEQTVRFCVWDTGIGIAPADIPQLFQPFMQVDSSLTRHYEGTGLGLALVARMVQMHGGYVTVESLPGQGSRFTITLPVQGPVDHDRARMAAV